MLFIQCDGEFILVVKQIIKFGLVGVLGTFAHYVVLIIGVDYLKQGILISSSLGFIIGAFINHHFNRQFTFSSEKTYIVTLVQFMISASGLFALNLLVMYLLTDKLSFQYLVAQIITTGIVFFSGFIVNKLFIFKR